jgi:hypothetical protein
MTTLSQFAPMPIVPLRRATADGIAKLAGLL